jgi:hypothetical protein
MKRTVKAALHDRYVRMFPDPLETRLIQIRGGTTLTIGTLRREGRPFTVVISNGRLLRSERFRRSVIDDQGMLANDLKWAIKLQGPEYERDVVAAYERDEAMAEAGWIVKTIPVRWLYENPNKVRTSVRQFIYS